MFNFGDIDKMYRLKRRDEKKKEDKDFFVITDFVKIMSQKEYKKFQEQLRKENK
jgi:type I site-specific restriction endonuclease